MEEEDKEEGRFLEGQMNAIFNPLEKLANSKVGKAVGKAVGAVNEASLNIGAQFIGGQLGAPVVKFAVNQGVIGYDKALGSLHQFISDKTNIDQRAVGLVADPLNFVPGIGLAGKAGRVANTTTRTATKAASFQRKLQKGIQNSLKAERGAIRVGSKNNKLKQVIDGLSTKVRKPNGNGVTNGHASINPLQDLVGEADKQLRKTWREFGTAYKKLNPEALPAEIKSAFEEAHGLMTDTMGDVHKFVHTGRKTADGIRAIKTESALDKAWRSAKSDKATLRNVVNPEDVANLNKLKKEASKQNKEFNKANNLPSNHQQVMVEHAVALRWKRFWEKATHHHNSPTNLYLSADKAIRAYKDRVEQFLYPSKRYNKEGRFGIISTAEDVNTIHLHDVETGKNILSIPVHTENFRDLIKEAISKVSTSP